MRKAQLMVSALLLVLLLGACTPKAAPVPQAPAPAAAPVTAAPQAPVKAAWEMEWEKTLEAARAERTVTIYGTAGSDQRAALTEAIRKKYGLRAETVSGPGGAIAERQLSERRAGVYSADVFVGGASTPITSLKPARALDPLEPALILPDAKDPTKWWGGKLAWVDNDHTELSTLAEPEATISINTNLVQPGEVKSFKDLLNPKWKGKIILRDVTVPGGARKWFAGSLHSGMLSEDYMRQLNAQKGGIIRDGRLQAEWLVQGKYAIAVSTHGQVMEPMLAMGVPVKQIIPEEGTHLSSGSGCVALMNRAPHPNAAKVFINWFLTKEGQTVLTKAMGSPSRRLDVPTDHLRPEQLLQPGVKYFDPDDEEFILKELDFIKLGKEIFGIQ